MTTAKHLIRSFLALGLLGAGTASACQYCEMAGALRGRFGSSPAAVEVSPYDTPAPAATPAALTTPPPAASIVTQASGLKRVASLPLPPLTQASPATPAKAVVLTPAIAAKAPSSRWADVGLLSLAAIGGLFYWRTRR